MSTYVRFIFVVLVAGVVVSLTIVVLSNERSRREQAIKLGQERAALRDSVRNMSDQLRRAEIAVNGQKIDYDGKVLETYLLVRQLTYKHEPLPVSEVVIPGSTICVDGIWLQFGPNYPEEWAEMRGTNLAMLMHVSGKDQKGELFSFWPGWSQGSFVVPEAMQIYSTGTAAHVTYFETKLWRNVWELMEAPKATRAKADFKVITSQDVSGLKTSAELRDLRRSSFYVVTVGLEGVTITESMNPEHRNAMVAEWEKKQKRKR